MSTILVYCINCGEKNPYTVSFRRVGRNVHGITFNYVKQIRVKIPVGGYYKRRHGQAGR